MLCLLRLCCCWLLWLTGLLLWLGLLLLWLLGCQGWGRGHRGGLGRGLLLQGGREERRLLLRRYLDVYRGWGLQHRRGRVQLRLLLLLLL